MALRDLPFVQAREKQSVEQSNGHRGAAHTRTRDAYRDVPILQQPTWGHEISAYFYLGGISSGAFVLAALAEVAGGRRRRALARAAHYVAFAALLPCPPLLIADLGRPARFHHMLRIVKPSSPMNLGAWTLTLHGAMSTLTTLRVLAAEGKVPVVGRALTLLPGPALAAGGLPSALTLAGYTGVLLGTSSVPVWSTSPLLGGLFMASALNTGTAATTLTMTLTGQGDDGDSRALAPFKLALDAGEAALLGGYLATTGRAAKPLLRGKTGLMMLASAASLAVATACEVVGLRADDGDHSLLRVCADGATLLGGFLLRSAVVQAGKASAADREGTLAAMQPSRGATGWGQ